MARLATKGPGRTGSEFLRDQSWRGFDLWRIPAVFEGVRTDRANLADEFSLAETLRLFPGNDFDPFN